jgi:hypothetical protein
MHMSIRRQHPPILTALRSASAVRLPQSQRAGGRSSLADHVHLRSNNNRMVHRRMLWLTTEHTAGRQVSCAGPGARVAGLPARGMTPPRRLLTYRDSTAAEPCSWRACHLSADAGSLRYFILQKSIF